MSSTHSRTKSNIGHSRRVDNFDSFSDDEATDPKTPTGVMYQLGPPSDSSSDSFPIEIENYQSTRKSRRSDSRIKSARNDAEKTQRNVKHAPEEPTASSLYRVKSSSESSYETNPGSHSSALKWPDCIPKLESFQSLKQPKLDQLNASIAQNGKDGLLSVDVGITDGGLYQLEGPPESPTDPIDLCWPSSSPKLESFCSLKKPKRDVLKAKFANEPKHFSAKATWNNSTSSVRPTPIIQSVPQTHTRSASPRENPTALEPFRGPTLRQVQQPGKNLIVLRTLKVPNLNEPDALPPYMNTDAYNTAQCGKPDEEWAKTAHQCSGCLTIVPHSQLFVCIDSKCVYNVKSARAVYAPIQFFRMEKVFCGTCSFRGCHSPHAATMTEALPLAIQSASAEIGEQLTDEFKKMAELNPEEPADYFISGKGAQKQLDEIPVVDYLSNSPDVIEWDRRLKRLHELSATMERVRRESQEFVRKMAELALGKYLDLNETMNFDLQCRQPNEAEAQKWRLREHAMKMGLAEDYFVRNPPNRPRSSRASSRTHSSAHSQSSSHSIHSQSFSHSVPEGVHYVEDQGRLLDELDDEILGTH